VEVVADFLAFCANSYTGSNVVADVAYDIFTSYSPGGSSVYEIMIWLAAIGGAGPISSTGSPIATVTIAGTSWDLFKGPNGATTVFSFVAHSEQTSFNADVLDFLKYLIHSQGLPSAQYVSGIAAGTEPFDGSSAQLTTHEYIITIA
jgi:xyloglucan-specific endo-beta-1,4-glucanase